MPDSAVTDHIALYNPSGALSIIAFLIFLTLAAGHWYRYIRLRRAHDEDYKYMRLVRWGSTFMAFGFIARFSRRNGIDAWSWLFETLFILLSPCAFIAQIYILLTRLAQALDAEDCLLLPPRALKWIFIPADLTTVLAQLAGTAMTITFGTLVSIGSTLVTVALIVQLVFFLAFIAVYVTFGTRMHKRGSHATKWYQISGQSTVPAIPTTGQRAREAYGGLGGDKWYARWTTLYIVLGVSCGFMMIRSIYRVAEYGAGADSKLAYSEAAFYILDSIMMLGISLSLLIVWPPTCLAPRSTAALPMRRTDQHV